MKQNFRKIAMLVMTMFSFALSYNIPSLDILSSSEIFYNRNVLLISIQPGQENVTLLSSLYLRYGSRMSGIYITNGENGQNDNTNESPLRHAATIRTEATNVMRVVNGDATFFNFADHRCIQTVEENKKKWNSVLLISKLSEIIIQKIPDVIVLFADYDEGENSVRQKFVVQALLESTKQLRDKEHYQNRSGWIVEKIFNEKIDRQKTKGIKKESNKFLSLSGILDSAYTSIYVQRKLRHTVFNSRFIQIFPNPNTVVTEISLSPFIFSLKKFQRHVISLCKLFESFRPSISEQNKKTLQQGTTQLLASIDSIILMQPKISSKEQWKLYLLKNSLEKIKTRLMNITVHYSLSDSILTERQVTFFRIDSISQLPAGANVEIFFPPLLKGWLCPDLRQSQTTLQFGKTYSFISPQKISYTIPRTIYGLQQPSTQSFFDFVLFSRHHNPDETFNNYISIPIDFAPRFSVEPLTPLVNINKKSNAIIRLRNHSRDGVKDFLTIDETIVKSDTIHFRLNNKDDVLTDTLKLKWYDSLASGTYFIPLRIHRDSAGFIAGRKFTAGIDTTLRIGLLSGYTYSETEKVLTNLGQQWKKISTLEQLHESLEEFTTVVIDNRTFSQLRFTEKVTPSLLGFIADGKHLIVLSQDEVTWNTSPFKNLFTLHSTNTIPANIDVILDSTDSMFRFPNQISNDDFTDWIVRRSYNDITVITDSITVPLYSSLNPRTPLVLEKIIGRGKLTYINVDLLHQWMNLHAGSYRFFANILAQRTDDKH